MVRIFRMRQGPDCRIRCHTLRSPTSSRHARYGERHLSFASGGACALAHRQRTRSRFPPSATSEPVTFQSSADRRPIALEDELACSRSYDVFRRTPGPAVSSPRINITPAVSKARWTAWTLSNALRPGPIGPSIRLMLIMDSPEAAASSGWDQPTSALAARICSARRLIRRTYFVVLRTFSVAFGLVTIYVGSSTTKKVQAMASHPWVGNSREQSYAEQRSEALTPQHRSAAGGKSVGGRSLSRQSRWLDIDSERQALLQSWGEMEGGTSRDPGPVATVGDLADGQHTSAPISGVEARLRVLFKLRSNMLRNLSKKPASTMGEIIENVAVAERLVVREENPQAHDLIARVLRDLVALQG